MLVLLTTLVLKQREVPATVSSFCVSVLYTATLRTSIAAVVLGFFYFRPLDCDASVIVVDCAAVRWDACWKNTKRFQQNTCSFLFFRLDAAAAAAAACCCCPQHQY